MYAWMNVGICACVSVRVSIGSILLVCIVGCCYFRCI